jgi:hypothetical protein
MHRERQFLEHFAQVGELQRRDRQFVEQRPVGADLAVPAQHKQVDRVVVEIGAVVGQAAAIGVQRGHQRQQQRVARQRQQVGALAGGEQVVALAFGVARWQPLRRTSAAYQARMKRSICSSSKSASA